MVSHESMSSITTLTNAVSDKPEKAALPIDVTLSGMVTDVKPLQPEYLQRTDSQVDANKTVEK